MNNETAKQAFSAANPNMLVVIKRYQTPNGVHGVVAFKAGRKITTLLGKNAPLGFHKLCDVDVTFFVLTDDSKKVATYVVPTKHAATFVDKASYQGVKKIAVGDASIDFIFFAVLEKDGAAYKVSIRDIGSRGKESTQLYNSRCTVEGLSRCFRSYRNQAAVDYHAKQANDRARLRNKARKEAQRQAV